MENEVKELLEEVKLLFRLISDSQRLEVMSEYCKYCGQDEIIHGKCYCAPHFDE